MINYDIIDIRRDRLKFCEIGSVDPLCTFIRSPLLQYRLGGRSILQYRSVVRRV